MNYDAELFNDVFSLSSVMLVLYSRWTK